MSKVNYNDITFDSELEVEYYKYLVSQNLHFIYHPLQITNILGKRSYTPDFIVIYDDRIEVVETKGYNQYSHQLDDQIHFYMKKLTEVELKFYIENNCIKAGDRKCLYRKLKYLKAYGWVDYEWKNPNTLSKKRKEKIDEQKLYIKELKKELKDLKKLYSIIDKTLNGEKITKANIEWIEEFRKRYEENLEKDNSND